MLTPAELEIVRSGKAEKKRELLESMPPDKIEDMLVAMTQRQRLQLFAPASSTVRREIFLLNGSAAGGGLRSSGFQDAARRREHAPAGRRAGRFLVQPLQRLLREGRGPLPDPAYEREAIRPHVLGQFRDLLEATAKSPAMLFFLDNSESVRPDLDANDKKRKVKRGLNENYGRELMELHTLGVDGGYTQKDVTEVARCFTGWTIHEPRKGGSFFYNDSCTTRARRSCWARDPGRRRHGRRRKGARYSGATSLHRALHFEGAGAALRRRRSAGGAGEPDGADLPRHRRQHSRSDEDHAQFEGILVGGRVSRQSEIAVSKWWRARRARWMPMSSTDGRSRIRWGTLGEPLYRKLEPTGYSNLNAEWVNSASLLGRMNFALQLAQNHVESVKVDVSRFGDDPSEVAKALMFRAMSPQTRAAIDKALEDKSRRIRRWLPGW